MVAEVSGGHGEQKVARESALKASLERGRRHPEMSRPETETMRRLDTTAVAEDAEMKLESALLVAPGRWSQGCHGVRV